jgi:hypothetical protein
MLGSGTTARVIKGPREASQLSGIQYVTQSPNCPTCLSREPRWSHAMPQEGEPFSQTVHAHLIMMTEPCEKATDWTPVAQLPTNTKN